MPAPAGAAKGEQLVHGMGGKWAGAAGEVDLTGGIPFERAKGLFKDRLEISVHWIHLKDNLLPSHKRLVDRIGEGNRGDIACPQDQGNF